MISTTKEVLVKAFERRRWDPAFPNLRNLDLAAVSKMDGTERDAKSLIESFQRSSFRYNLLVETFHQRFEPNYDGEAHEATFALANSPGCPLPDFSPPPGASFHYDDPDLQSAVEKMQAATGQGSWQPGCHGNSKVHQVKVSYDDRNLSAKQKEWLPAIKLHNAAAVAAMGLEIIEVPVGEFANVEFYGKQYGRGTIGMAQFNSTSCGDSCFCTISPSYAVNFRMVLILVMHEFGHTMNFEHSNNFIMNPFIMDVPEYWVQRDGSGLITYQDVRYAKGKQFFGGDPLITIPGEPPQPPVFLGELEGGYSRNGELALRGVIDVVIGENQKPGTYRQILGPGSAPNRFKFTPKVII